MINFSENFIYSSFIDYEYDSYHCDGCYGCAPEDGEYNNDYCRGSYYTGLRADGLKYDKLYESLELDNYSDVIKYSIDRLLKLHKFYDVKLYEVEAVGGYYGQEINTINHENYHTFMTDVKTLFSLDNDADIIKFILNREYNYLVHEFEAVEIIEVNKGDLVPTENMKHVSVDGYDKIDSIPIGIYQKINDKYRIVDGRHRWLLASDNVKIIVIK